MQMQQMQFQQALLQREVETQIKRAEAQVGTGRSHGEGSLCNQEKGQEGKKEEEKKRAKKRKAIAEAGGEKVDGDSSSNSSSSSSTSI